MDGTLFTKTAHTEPWKQNLAEEARGKLQKQRDLADRIAQEAQELGSLAEWLTHAKALLGSDFPVLPTEADEKRPERVAVDDDASHAEIIWGAIADALMSAPQGLKTDKLREEVLKNPDAKQRIDERPNRYYAVLNRRVARGSVIKRGRLYRLPVTLSPEGETGAVAAPASHND